jgi:hypothetical protein
MKKLFLIPLLFAAAVVAQQAPTAAELVKKLGHEDYAVREQAMKQLIEMGEPAVPALEEALKSDDLEVRLRAGRALRAIGGNGGEASKDKSDGADRDDGDADAPRERPLRQPGNSASSVQIEMVNGKVRVTVRETVDGKQTEKTYEGESLEALKKEHPELQDKLGGFRFHVGRDPLDMDDFWKNWNKQFDEDFMRRWQQETARDMERMRRLMRSLQQHRGLRERVPQAGQLLGVRARKPEAVLDAQLELRGRGLVVDAVEKGSLADHLGMQAFDILLELNGVEVRDVRDVARALKSREETEGTTARVMRRGRSVDLKWSK